ncbi:MAG: phospho-sugar mutase [Puniceicoccales bacterium]|jgi:phosphoglucomutase|nr:phospho-sugar mutase [Puniceicoccales bacterium]
MNATFDQLQQAVRAGKLLESTLNNIVYYLNVQQLPDWFTLSLEELVAQRQWAELDDRFFKCIEFGTAGMRGRTIGNYATTAEKKEHNHYVHAAIGSNCMNDFNVIKATLGLFKYCRIYIEETLEFPRRPSLVVAHDMRYFSRHFCELIASNWSQLGGDVYVFDGPRSTPQLSFSIRYLGVTAGIMITASHNPFYDNGYKVYLQDGAQVCDAHAKGITRCIEQVSLQETLPFLTKDIRQVFCLSPLNDEAYLECVQEVLLDVDVLKIYKPKVVYTPLHGTGSVSILPLLKNFEWNVHCVDAQLKMDPAFPTIQFPNPEHKEALKMALDLAQEIDADAVIATDPDGDRMGVALKNDQKEWCVLSGNTLAVLLAEYRISKMICLGILPRKQEKRRNAALIKSFVTTPMLKAIGDYHGLKTVETLTGFKWIGAKLNDYEIELKQRIRKMQGLGLDYNQTSFKKRKDLLLQHATFYIFGGEESYGYLANDRVRDKDANAAALMFCEFLAYLKSKEINFSDYLDEMYCKYGYFQEDLLSFSFEGAAGFSTMQKLLTSYRQDMPKRINNIRVLSVTDFSREGHHKDCDGKIIAAANFLIIKLIDGFSVAVRGSGTEPKVKIYLLGQSEVEHEDLLPHIKQDVAQRLRQLKEFLREDVAKRVQAKRIT